MNELTNFFLAEGEEARKAQESKPHKKTNYVKLKDGESIRGFLLTTDFKMYMAHGDFNKKIKTHTCKNPKNNPNVECLSCKHQVKRSKKTIVPLYNVDTKQVEIFDASPTAMKAVYAFVDQYEEESITTPISLSRAGNDTGTTYSMMPVRVKAAEKDLFVIPEDVELNTEFYEGVLNIPDDKYVRQLLGLEEGDEDVKDLGSNDDSNESESNELPF